MAANIGVFIRSTKRLDDVIAACNNLIRNSNSGGKITLVREDKTYGGIKVLLNGDDIVQELLRKQFLFETGDLSTIHPLNTHLTVQDAIISTTEEEFVEELRQIVQDALGPVLKVSKVPISKLYPDIGNGNWRVLLNIPEIEDLDIYKKKGLPDELKIKVPGVHGRLPVRFYCTKCEKDGHSQWRCLKSIKIETKSVSASVKDLPVKILGKSPAPSGSFKRAREEESSEKDIVPKNKSIMRRKNIRKFESEIGKEDIRNYYDSFPLKGSIGIKREVGEPSSSDRPAKKARASPMIDDDSQSENLPKASSTTTDDDCVEIVYDCDSVIPFKNQPHFSSSPSLGQMLIRNNVDDSVSTSNQPVPPFDTIKSEMPSANENESDSNQGASVTKPVRQRKKPAQGIPIVIPERIEGIISKMEADKSILDIEQLTAFFNHVKKKSKPCTFAKMYTTDVPGLKKQLEGIKRRFYMIPERGSNEELQFMKRFVNILERFDGVSTPRKKKN